MDSLEAKANFSRVCQLLIDKGGVALRAALHAVHPPATLAAALSANKRALNKIRYSVIKPSQWDLLFPASGSPNSNNFDVTLLTILLRNICGLPSPSTGWNVMPPASETSVPADILRIKILRNEVYGHIPTAQYDDTTFEKLWQDISRPLVKLGIPQQDIDKLREAPLSPEEEMYIEKLKEWKELEDNLMAKINDVDKKVENLTEEFVKQREALANVAFSKVDQLAKFYFTGKIDDLGKKFQNGTREWFFRRLSSWFTDENSRVMILTAGPGIGKSVLAAKVCELYKQRGQLAACHFCNVGTPDFRNPYKILQSLASQMCDNVDGFRDKLTEALRREHSQDSLSGAFRVLLNDPLYSLERSEPMLIVVDALDESKTAEKSEFLELIKEYFHELPKWVKILITSRPELQVKEELRDFYHLEILPKDRDHNKDVEDFIRCRLPNLDKGNVSLLMSKCEGSFLYAFYVVKDLKEITNMGIEVSELIPTGMPGFYKKQFERLRTGLQHFNIDIVRNGFINVVAASREPLPIQILLKCMNVSDEKYEVRNSIINIMSEILPIYEDCLTIYHKSLLDWLTLKGYEEHEFVADIADGNKRLWSVCKSIYSDVDVLVKSTSKFRITPDIRYALANGAQYLVNVAHMEDFHWLLNVGLNFLKFKIFNNMKVDLRNVLTTYKSKLPDDLYWRIFQTHAIMEAIRRADQMILPIFGGQKLSYIDIYLQSLSNGIFNFRKDTFCDQSTARNILQQRNEVWIEEVTNGGNSNFTVISNAVINGRSFIMNRPVCSSSPDKKLLAWLDDNTIKVFMLPSLTMIFELKIGTELTLHRFIIFSPDSSYLLYDSVKSCVMIREQKQVPFIPHSPEFINSCSFSSCGMELITSEDDCIKVWNLRTKDLLQRVQVEELFLLRHVVYTKCNAYICGQGLDHSKLAIWDSTTLEQLDIKKICVDPCLTKQDNIQFIPNRFSFYQSGCIIETGHFHLPNGKIVLPRKDNCLEPFSWKDRKCLGFINLSSSLLSLVVCDFINQKVVDLFQIGGIPNDTSIDYISNLDEKNFLISLNSSLFVLSFESSESPVASSIINSAIRCSALSPSNLYLACCYYNHILAIRSVDNPDILQIVKLKHSPEACWWSELYLWVVCKGAVVKFPFDSTHKNVLGKCLQECDLNFDEVLKFAQGVLVIRINEEISILKICDEKLCRQEIPDPTFSVSCLAISSDGCAVLLYRKSFSDYQLWEKARGNRWGLFLSEKIKHHFEMINWICLTGTRNSRRSKLLVDYSEEPWSFHEFFLLSFDFSNSEEHLNPLFTVVHSPKEVTYFDPDFLIIREEVWIHFIKVSCCKIVATLYLGFVRSRMLGEHSMFYLPSRGVLLLVVENDIKYLKIHNIENYLI